MQLPTRAELGVLVIAVAGCVLLGIGMLDGELVHAVVPTPSIPADGTLVEQADAMSKAVEDLSTLNPDIGINLFSTIGKALVVTPFLAGGFALQRLVRGRGIPARSIGELAIITSLIAGATILIRLAVSADAAGPLGALARALGADRGVDVALDAGGQLTVVTLVLLCMGGVLALDIGRRRTPGDPFPSADR